jgi:two-component system CheB/CheR fusion protein
MHFPSTPPIARVLVIEDNQDTAESIARFLRVGCGFDVRTTLDGEKGLKLALADPPDAIVCDIGLPRLNGLKVARELTDTLTIKPLLIAVTAYGGTYPEDMAREAGFDHYLVKPADPFRIEGLIQGHVRDKFGDGETN